MQIHLSKSIAVCIGVLMLAPWLVVIWILNEQKQHSAPTLPELTSVAEASSQSTRGTSVNEVVPTTQTAAASTASGTTDNSQLSVSEASGRITYSRDGAWGNLEYVPIVLELPDEYVFVPPENFPPVKWTFPGLSKARAVQFLAESGLTLEQMRQVREAKWTEIPGGSTVEPGDPLILSLDSETRAKVYTRLISFKENERIIDPYWYRPGKVDLRLRGSELSVSSINLLKKLLYQGGPDLLLFADVEPAVRSIPDPAERQRFMKAVSRKRSLLARLIVTKDTDVSALADYWGADGRQKDLIPLLNSLKYNTAHGIEDAAQINVLCLLPPFARDRLYNHPFSSDPANGMKEDCFWSAFNFFNPDPDYRVNDLTYAAQLLQKDYYKIAQPSRVGDLILLADTKGNAVHAASFIADEVVFTKNGENHTQPWMLMRMQDMLDTYRIKTPDLQILCYRKKSF